MDAPRRFAAACVQMRCVDDKAANVSRAVALMAEAADRGARLVALPEMFFWRGPGKRDAEAAESLEGPTVDALREAAQAHSLVVVGGSILEISGTDALPFNTSMVLGPDGAMLGVYRKIHLFDVEIPGKVAVRESDRFGSGADPVCVDTPLGRLGMSICYDLRFPELYRRLIDEGAEVLLAPSAFTFSTGAAHWDVLLRARAIESQCWLLAPNQVGPVSNGPLPWGHSSIVDPWGAVVAQASDEEGVVMGVVDLDYQDGVRGQLPALQHRRL